jgi:hypothetical protein
MIGLPPLTYLAQWRMQLAKREIQAGASVSGLIEISFHLCRDETRNASSAVHESNLDFIKVLINKLRHSSFDINALL